MAKKDKRQNEKPVSAGLSSHQAEHALINYLTKMPDGDEVLRKAGVTRARLKVMMYDDEIIGIELAASVELNVAETEPGEKGDRVSGAKKPATLETGLVVQVPLFIQPGERIKVDTRSGEFISRA